MEREGRLERIQVKYTESRDGGRSYMHLRLAPALSGRELGINWASDYVDI